MTKINQYIYGNGNNVIGAYGSINIYNTQIEKTDSTANNESSTKSDVSTSGKFDKRAIQALCRFVTTHEDIQFFASQEISSSFREFCAFLFQDETIDNQSLCQVLENSQANNDQDRGEQLAHELDIVLTLLAQHYSQNQLTVALIAHLAKLLAQQSAEQQLTNLIQGLPLLPLLQQTSIAGKYQFYVPSHTPSHQSAVNAK
ncbi:hypothetical protein BKG93_09905 [Rodentibacter ratti]|uniref:Uncharacterized protein n=1 Tax=Rodentibacter ratti TaxID=1906745 RepID=A0A1V3L287_9PAST|nr:hypothetical protein [Rodentibacter ratti]OOF83523.1 hypothetical protein BKG93_09905 [Rodentibacter ratti]